MGGLTRIWNLLGLRQVCGCAQDAGIGGIVLDSCNGVTLTGPANMTYVQDQWPFGQGTILAIGSDNLNYTIKVCSQPPLLLPLLNV